MLDDWFSVIKLPMSDKHFHRLPENPAYQYEYSDKTARLSPRPKFYHARLQLPTRNVDRVDEVDIPEGVKFRPLADRDWPHLSRTFAESFRRVQPFASLSDRRRLESARHCLKYTRAGGDGPIIHPACSIAVSERHHDPVGAILVTLIPAVDLDDFWSLRWETTPCPRR